MKSLPISTFPAKLPVTNCKHVASYSPTLPEFKGQEGQSEARFEKSNAVLADGSRPNPIHSQLAAKALDRQSRSVLMHAVAKKDEYAANSFEDDIDHTRIDLADALRYVDFPSYTPLLNEKSLNRQRRKVLECMRAFAKDAYITDFTNAASIGNLTLCTKKSTSTLKFWEVTSRSDVHAVVLGFSGTRMAETADLLCDFKGQIPKSHINPLGAHLSRLGLVGHGWQERWQSEALALRGDGQRLADILTSYATAAQQSNKPLSVSVVGHSLGAAVASLAGIDIANFLSAIDAKGKVSAYVFNPPRLGFGNIEEMYRKAVTSNPSQAFQSDMLRFSLLQFTRDLDPVQSLPLFMEHPDWPKRQRSNTRNVSPGLKINTYNDRATDRVNLAANHELEAWKAVIESDIPKDKLKSLFGDDQNAQDTNQVFRISRRSLLSMFFSN